MVETVETEFAGMKLIGRGATAEVYVLPDGRVLKLFNRTMSRAAVEYEARIAEAVNGLGLPAPKCFGMARWAGEPLERYGILYEYAEGPSALEELLGTDEGRKAKIDELARTHLSLFKRVGETVSGCGLPPQNVRFAECLARTDLSGSVRSKLLALLETFPKRVAVCHGDFHPGNVHRGKKGLIVLDWMNAYAGNPAGDAVRSVLMLESPALPVPMNALQRFFFVSLKRRLARRYRREIEREMPIERYDEWRAVIAGVRLSDRIPGEEAWLARIIARGLFRARLRGAIPRKR